MKRNLYILIEVFIIGCSTQNIDLPKTEYFRQLPKQGLNHNVILNLKGYDLYYNGTLISDSESIWNVVFNCVTLNDGSNTFTFALAIDKKTEFIVVDSVLHKLAQNNISSVFLLTNDIIDSVGINIMNSWFFENLPPEFRPPPLIDSNNVYSIHNVTFDKEYIYIDSNKINISEVDTLWESLIGSEYFINICPNPDNSYSQVIHVLDSYLKKHDELRNNYCYITFGDEYEKLLEFQKLEVDKTFEKSIIINHIEK